MTNRRMNSTLRTAVRWLIAAAGLFGASYAIGQEVRIWPTAVVSAPEVRLRDVASIRGGNAWTAARLAEVVVNPQPPEYGMIVVDLAAVRSAIAGSKLNAAHVRLIGASACAVRCIRREPGDPPAAPSADAVPTVDSPPIASAEARREPAAAPVTFDGPPAAANSLEAAVREFVARRLPIDGGRVSIRFSAASASNLRQAEVGARFNVRSRERVPLGLVGFDVTVERAAQRDQALSVFAEVSLTRPVVVARRAINRGRVISSDDVALEERTFARADDLGITDARVALGQEAKNFIRPGGLVLVRDLRHAPLVRRGDLVHVISRRGALTIKSVARAVGEGGLGDAVTVRNDATRESFEATVAGERLVCIGSPSEVASQ